MVKFKFSVNQNDKYQVCVGDDKDNCFLFLLEWLGDDFWHRWYSERGEGGLIWQKTFCLMESKLLPPLPGPKTRPLKMNDEQF